MNVRIHALLCALALLAITAATAHAQNTSVKWKLLTPIVKGAPGEVVDVKIQASIEAGWHLYTTMKYPDTAEAAPSPTEVTVGERSLVTMAGRIKGTKPHRKFDEGFELNTEFWEGTATLVVPVRIAAKAKPGSAQGWVNFYFQTCKDGKCMPPTDEKISFALEVLDKQASADSAAADTAVVAAAPGAQDTAAAAPADTAAAPTADTATAAAKSAEPVAPKTDKSTYGPTGSQDDIAAARSEGLIAYLGLAALMGLLALVTPCVFPMIPITVSFFTKREHTTKARSIRDAAFYSLGIIFTFTALGVIVSLLFGAAGVGNFATNPWVNMLMAGVFMLLALNLFGMFEITVPTSILNKLNRSANKGSGIGSVMLMGLVFSLTSFTCTVPFVGSLLVNASQGDILWPLMGTAAFAAVFSLPFFLLAMFPALLKSLPKSGGWLNSVKVVMGFAEVAFAVKFLAGTDLVWSWGIFTREMCLAIWISVTVLTTTYLLGRFQLPHDTPVEKVGPLRVLFATGALALGFWMLTGLFGANLGELEAQLPPPVEGAASAKVPGKEAAHVEDRWMLDNYEAAIAKARAEGKQVFVDFTGYNCSNCRWMDRNMFTKKEVAEVMNKFVLVRLYTDGRDAVHKKNQKMLQDRFGTITIPYYAVVSSDDKVIAKFDGMTRNKEQFLEFLQQGLNPTGGTVAQHVP